MISYFYHDVLYPGVNIGQAFPEPTVEGMNHRSQAGGRSTPVVFRSLVGVQGLASLFQEAGSYLKIVAMIDDDANAGKRDWCAFGRMHACGDHFRLLPLVLVVVLVLLLLLVPMLLLLVVLVKCGC